MLSGHKPDDPRLELYMVLKELNVKMYSSELYDNYMNVVDATDKKLVEEQNVNYYNNEKHWNKETQKKLAEKFVKSNVGLKQAQLFAGQAGLKLKNKLSS